MEAPWKIDEFSNANNISALCEYRLPEETGKTVKSAKWIPATIDRQMKMQDGHPRPDGHP